MNDLDSVYDFRALTIYKNYKPLPLINKQSVSVIRSIKVMIGRS